MRTLTQVWVFFLTLTFLFLILGFQLAGRAGLLTSFIFIVLMVYATLHRGYRVFKKKLAAQNFCGNEPSGFLNEIQKQRLNYGFKNVFVYTTIHDSPPLVWKSRHNQAHILINCQLLSQLNELEIQLLTSLLLSHLQKRSFLMSPILSVVNQSFFVFNFLFYIPSFLINLLFNTKGQLIAADNQFKLDSKHTNVFEQGYFLNKLHHFKFHKNHQPLGTEYFSVLSFNKTILPNRYGIPNLNIRLKNIMGFNLETIKT